MFQFHSNSRFICNTMIDFHISVAAGRREARMIIKCLRQPEVDCHRRQLGTLHAQHNTFTTTEYKWHVLQSVLSLKTLSRRAGYNGASQASVRFINGQINSFTASASATYCVVVLRQRISNMLVICRVCGYVVPTHWHLGWFGWKMSDALRKFCLLTVCKQVLFSV